LASESDRDNKKIVADLGSAFFLRGDKQKANQLWAKIIDSEAAIDDYRLYVETLLKHNLNEQARQRTMPFVITSLTKEFRAEADSQDSPRTEEENFRSLVKLLAGSFSEVKAGVSQSSTAAETAKARFFARLCSAAPENRFLPALLMRESLIAPQERGAFYEILIKRSSGLGTYDSDYSYTALRDTNFDDSDAESALDQQADYKISEPDSSRVNWQREYLDYLMEHRRTADARRLIASIERDIQRRYARPVWLRLAAIRLDVRDGRLPQAMDHLQWLVGIKTGISVDNPKPPSIERLNDAVALLINEGHQSEARKLQETAYARGLALGHFEPAYFAGLARLAFERGDKSVALTWLQSMIDLTAPDNEETVASLMA